MGVRGLTTFIKNQEKKYLKDHKLYNCTVLLDGNSVASNLFIWSNIESAFGGDYDKFAKYVREFFKALLKCNIRPLVVFDGGYEGRKLKTVYSRMREKFKSACRAQPLTGSLNFPLFMRIVFREVLVELNISFAQSDYEADDELAALARQLQCPVMSYDSDFYIYDVLYIPLPTLNLEPIAFNSAEVTKSNGAKYYLGCKIYSIDVFIESFGGLERNMLPVLATLLGNDYIKRSVFKAFYTNLKIPKGKTSPLQRRIKAVVEWLRKETFETAVQKVLGRMRKQSRKRVMGQLRKTVNGYVQRSSILSQHLGVSTDVGITTLSNDKESSNVDSKMVNIFQTVYNNLENVEDEVESESHEETSENNEEDLHITSDDASSLSESDCEDNCNVEVNAPEQKHLNSKSSDTNSSNIPDWLLDSARKGKIQSCVIDILSLNQYFFPPQVEDYSLSPSHFISLPVLNATVGLLLGKSDNLVKYWTRNGSHLDWYTVEPIYETASLTFPPIDGILKIVEPLRKAALLEVANVSIDLSEIPEELHLFVIAILYWLKNMKYPTPTESHLHTMIMCIVTMFGVDSKIGIHRNKQSFMRKYKTLLNKTLETRRKENYSKQNVTTNLQNKSAVAVTKRNVIANISHEDCILAFESILPNHHLNEQIKTKPKLFCLSTIHAFAQFQSCLFHLMVFNSVLGQPFQEVCVSRLYSGTFVYNTFTNLSKRSNIVAYVQTLFQNAPSLLNAYNVLFTRLEESLNDVVLYKKPQRLHKKKKKQNQPTKVADIIQTNQDEEDGDIFLDENNLFSRLSLSTSS